MKIGAIHLAPLFRIVRIGVFGGARFSGYVEVPQAVDFTGEPVFELAPRPGIVLTGNWLMLGFAHAAIMARLRWS
jgi:hypothetical protein